ncbi:MAG: hypothetical protein WAR57_02875 [Candidatus Phosphoribacter sp.]
MIERFVCFDRPRRMRCGTCQHEWHVTAEWLERFNQALENCPVCGTDCRGEGRPDFCAEPGGPLRDDAAIREFSWYHSSTQENWPDKSFDPAAELTDLTKQRMKGMGLSVEGWAARQKAKALHVGTYEAAIENVFRRMDDQSGSLEQFYLYRVQLSPDCRIEPGVHLEPTDFVGNAHLADVCAPGTTVLRYVNVHEDPSSVSLALEPDAIHAVQRIQIPLPVDAAEPWVRNATARLVEASSKASAQPMDGRKPWHQQRISALASEAGRLESEVAAGLPMGLRRRFRARFNEAAFDAAPASLPTRLVGLARLVTDAQSVLDALDLQPGRKVT